MHRRAFTLIELLVVIAIVAVLAAMLLPTVGMVRASAEATHCRSSLRQLAMGIEVYCSGNDGRLPPSMTAVTGHPWFTLIAGDLGMPDVYAMYPGSANQACITLRDQAGNNLVWGCPCWRRSPSANQYYPGLAYTMKPAMPKDLNHNNLMSVWGRTFARATITLPAQRILLGDSIDFILNVSGSTATSFVGSSGDPLRHQNKANYAFFDGHVANLAVAQQPWLGIADPTATAWSP